MRRDRTGQAACPSTPGRGRLAARSGALDDSMEVLIGGSLSGCVTGVQEVVAPWSSA